jgi:hypothetical protein
MKIEDVIYSAVTEARQKKRVTKYSAIYDKVRELQPGEAFSVKVQDENFKNVMTRIRRIVIVLRPADNIDVESISCEGYIYVSMKPQTKQEPTKIKNKA